MVDDSPNYIAVLPENWIKNGSSKKSYEMCGVAWTLEDGGISVHLTSKLSSNRIALIPNVNGVSASYRGDVAIDHKTEG